MQLSTAKVLVTGGGTGIGLAIATRLRAEGAQVAISGRRQAVLDEAARAIGAIPIVADVTREDDVARLVETTARELGGYDTLVNNAGMGRFGALVDLTADDMRAVWETNVLGPTLVARESARHFVRERRGHIVNVASTAAHKGSAGTSAYTSSKWALAGLTECWRLELRPHGIRVMQVNPSEVVTPFFESAGLGERPDNPTKLHAEDIAHVVASLLALDDRGMVTDATVWASNPKG